MQRCCQQHRHLHQLQTTSTKSTDGSRHDASSSQQSQAPTRSSQYPELKRYTAFTQICFALHQHAQLTDILHRERGNQRQPSAEVQHVGHIIRSISSGPNPGTSLDDKIPAYVVANTLANYKQARPAAEHYAAAIQAAAGAAAASHGRGSFNNSDRQGELTATSDINSVNDTVSVRISATVDRNISNSISRAAAAVAARAESAASTASTAPAVPATRQ